MDNRENIQRQEPEHVPYVVYRDAVSDRQWIVKMLVRAIVVLVIVIIVESVILYLNNRAWLHTWEQYDYSGESIEASVDSEGDGIANYTGGNGGVIYGEGDSAQDNVETD